MHSTEVVGTATVRPGPGALVQGWLRAAIVNPRSLSELPRFDQRLSVEGPQKRGDEDQDGLVNRAGDGNQADHGEPSERARDSTVAGE